MIASRLALLLLPAAFLAAQVFSDYSEGMKAGNAAVNAIRKLDKHTGEPAMAAAERLGGIYEDLIQFWRQRNVADAVTWSQEGKAAAVAMATSAYAGDAAKFDNELKALNRTCQQCHDKYRERTADGEYRFKSPQSQPR